MKPFADYFSIEAIMEEICAQRIKVATKKHGSAFYDRISKDHQHDLPAGKEKDVDLKAMLPSRRCWSNFRPPQNKRKGRKPCDVHLTALVTAVRRLINENPTLPWVSKLLDRASLIRHKALHGENPRFSHERIIGQRKNPGSSDYRPITIYGLDDNIIQKITARYLSQTLDFCYSDASCAYRRSHPKAGAPINRESALRQIARFRAAHQTVYVAEADLRNFMDCVDHETARHALRRLIIQAKEIHPAIEVDPRAIHLYDVALDSYSFQRDVLGQATETLKRHDRHGRFIWPIEELSKMHGSTRLDEIGIPQGGALSCFVVNVLLHEVDQAVESTHVPQGHALKYLRYCDDMLILSTDRDVCQKAMEAYLAAIQAKRLLAHEPVDPHPTDQMPGTPHFLEVKSKKPYEWAKQEDGGIPQVQFLGFLIRYDGQFQIRPKSIHKQIRKIGDETKKLSRRIGSAGQGSHLGIQAGLNIPPHEVLSRFYRKLVAMSVGRRKPGQPMPVCRKDIEPMCWADGYKFLWEVTYDPAQLKELDHHRERAMQRVFDQLRPFMKASEARSDAEKAMARIREYGFGCSYYAQFAKMTGQQ